ncbi:hypothetical protein CTAYLR_001773 [Chrysophaeum taylorii]|uniref:Phosphoglycerate mutase n=1 Tax=Chrysophaeum taylorii TaxID=2483200 RepID=A0AAD7XL88_9STRA|nr:hypothetical protein CTAYLR_001773 [Chrysophaeum taylorii]
MARRVLLTRHGEALHNVMIAAGRRAGDAVVVEEGREMFDPALTETGQAQAEALARELEGVGIAIIVTSPLRRALETTRIVAERLKVGVVVSSLHTENGIVVAGDDVAGKPCQRGRSKGALLAEYPAWDFSGLDDVTWASEGEAWFHPSRVEDRIEAFSALVRELRPSDALVLVVGHSGFYKRLIGGGKMGNCELVERTL